MASLFKVGEFSDGTLQGSIPRLGTGQSGEVGLEPVVTGGASGRLGQSQVGNSAGTPQMSTTIEGRIVGAYQIALVLGQTPGGNSASRANATTHQATLARLQAEVEMEWWGGGCNPTVATGLANHIRRVDRLPGAGIQFMSRVGERLRVARVATEVKDPAVQHDSYVTTPRNTSA